jgi:hypothetical protein
MEKTETHLEGKEVMNSASGPSMDVSHVNREHAKDPGAGGIGAKLHISEAHPYQKSKEKKPEESGEGKNS